MLCGIIYWGCKFYLHVVLVFFKMPNLVGWWILVVTATLEAGAQRLFESKSLKVGWAT